MNNAFRGRDVIRFHHPHRRAPGVLLACSSLLGSLAAALAQSEGSTLRPIEPFATPATPDASTNAVPAVSPSSVTPTAPETTFLPSRLPSAPWLPADAPAIPDWAVEESISSPFLSPGLGTTSLGPSGLPGARSPGRPSGAVPPFRLGPIDLQPSLSYQLLYGTGLLAGPGREEESWIHTITPRLRFFAGDHWTVGYAPSIRIFDTEGYDNTVNHSVTLGGWAEYQNWRFRLNHATAITSDPLVETAQQTDQTTHSTALGATWDRAGRGAFDFSISQTMRFREESALPGSNQAGDAYSWLQQTWYDIPWREGIKVGAGAGFGYDLIDGGSDMPNERLSLRLTGDVGDRWSYALSGGVQFRQFNGSDASTSTSPLVSADISYQILENTAISLGFNHEVGISYFADQYTENTSFQGALTQVLTDRWRVSATGGYRVSGFESSVADTDRQREDTTLFAGASVTGQVFNGVSVSLFYTFRSNDSDQGGFSFDSHQVGLSLNWTL